MLEIYAFFFFAFLYIHLAKHQFYGFRYYFVFPTIVIIRGKIEKKKKRTSKSCVSQFVMYSELSSIKRLAWVKVSRKSNISTNESMPSISPFFLHMQQETGRRNWQANSCLFSISVSFKEYGSPFHLAPVWIPWVCHC